MKGFKNKIDIKEALTGRGFCELFGLDYHEVIHTIETDRKANLDYFLSELVKCKDIADSLEIKLMG
ncbi:MAG: hypothetical protein H7843_03615 [Nitrospirota bacterium]